MPVGRVASSESEFFEKIATEKDVHVRDRSNMTSACRGWGWRLAQVDLSITMIPLMFLTGMLSMCCLEIRDTSRAYVRHQLHRV